MVIKTLASLEINNEDSYDDLLISIESSPGVLSLLIAVCDDSNLREEIIKRYELELSSDIQALKLTLPRGEPNLTNAIAQITKNDEVLQYGGKAVLTVTGAEKLYFLKLGAEKSEQEIFFGYLQWTREALQEFRYPIVLWVTNQMLMSLSKKAPDFWSWRKGVFRFVSKKTNAVSGKEIASLSLDLQEQSLFGFDEDNPYFLPIEDLKSLIIQIEQQRGIKDPSLATLYYRIGQIYKRRLETSEAQNYLSEQTLAIEYFCKAANLQIELNKFLELCSTLDNLALLYKDQGNYQEAEHIYMDVLKLSESLLGKEHLDFVARLNNLAGVYRLQGRYEEAKNLYNQVLEITIRLMGSEDSNVAATLNNLGLLHLDLGQYAQAESLQIQALSLNQRLLGEDHLNVAASLNNLARVYEAQRRYQDAEPLYMQALEIRQRILGKEHPDVAASLNNLALLYYNQGRYEEAKHLYTQALKLGQQLLGERHLNIASTLNNLALVSQAQGCYQEAEHLYLEALEICQQNLKIDAPLNITIRRNLENLHITRFQAHLPL